MARMTGPKCRLCRREGMKLYLKGVRCYTAKCAIEKRGKPPGSHGEKRVRLTDYGVHLREKQRAKRYYGVLDRQFSRIYQEAARLPGNTGENLLILLERRLDNVVHRLGWGHSKANSRQMIRHGHIRVNGKRITIPSYLVKAADVLTPSPGDHVLKLLKEARAAGTQDLLPSWLRRNDNPPEGTMVQLPTRNEVPIPINEQLIVEFASK